MKQHSIPVLISADNTSTIPLTKVLRGGSAETRGYDEEFVKQLVLKHPEILPIPEIDPTCPTPVPICDELPTGAGPVDIFMLTKSGMPVLVECKLWANPQARREVVGQILDYAKDLQRWSYEDLQRAAAERVRKDGFSLFEETTRESIGLDEQTFVDSVTRNLRDGRCLLLVVGDGIREGVEAISEYLTGSGALQFSFGLVELPVFSTPAGDRLVTPRTLAKTSVIGRYVIAVESGHSASISEQGEADDPEKEARSETELRTANENLALWRDVLESLELDDPAQEIPAPKDGNSIFVFLPAPRDGSTIKDNWLTVYLARSSNQAGIFFTGTRTGYGGEIARAMMDNIDDILEALGARARWSEPKPGKINIGESVPLIDLGEEEHRAQLVAWLRERINTYVNVFRPRVEETAARVG
jgi:hypothetical protein